MNGWLDPAAAGAVLTPLVIFVAEMCVVTIGTTRTIFVSRGMKAPAALLGVFESSLWLLAVGQVFQNLGDLGCSAAYAGGFALGNYLGVPSWKRSWRWAASFCASSRAATRPR